MHLLELSVSGFRKLDAGRWSCAPGLNVLVGENNAGKTAFIDALRSVLGNHSIDHDDFYVDRTGAQSSETSIVATFGGLSVNDESEFLSGLIPTETPGTFNARIRFDASEQNDAIQRRTTIGNSGASFFELINKINIIYLPALRDPGTGLRAGRHSQIGALLHRITDAAQRLALEDIAKQSNDVMVAQESVIAATRLLNDNLVALSGAAYAQTTELSFAHPSFQRLAQSLEAMAEGLPITHNGLGSSNLLYIGAVLGNLIEDKASNYKALIIEEPEAHLHPHYQILLLRFLQATALENPSVQVFVTTHSPILASQAAANRITTIRSSDQGFVAGVISVQDRIANLRVRQYLDATRSELFFARRLMFVEGDAELLLLPSLTRRAGVDVAEQGISVVSAAGLNFNSFIPFVKGEVLGVPVAILSDGDPPVDVYPDVDGEVPRSRFAQALVEESANDSLLAVFLTRKTFEYDLCLYPENQVTAISAMMNVRPQLTRDFIDTHPNVNGLEFAKAFYRYFFQERDTSKPQFASEVSLYITEHPDEPFVVPPYINDALRHLMQ